MSAQTALLVFPHQLFYPHPGLVANRIVVLVEPWLFFRQYAFHKIKLAYHRATMQTYSEKLRNAGWMVEYITSSATDTVLDDTEACLRKLGITKIVCCVLADDYLERQVMKLAKDAGLTVEWLDSPAFLNLPKENEDLLGKRRPFFQTDFYTKQRKRLGILLDDQGKPVGGQWTYDTDNRLKYPSGRQAPQWPNIVATDYAKEAIAYVQEHFPNNPGALESLPYPIDHAGAAAWLQQFLEERFFDFGPYEDALVVAETMLHHSVLSPMLNTGLLTPEQVLDAVLQHAREYQIPLNSTEGLVRQIIGWREFIKAIYDAAGRKQRTTNFWGFNRAIPPSFYNGTTGIEPIDTTIRKLLSNAYNHHIERLMVLGNFFLLCEFDPDEVYRWFMEMYIDAYDWVMVPNVYGMTQFADGGLMTTKPYISGSNYLMKMGDFDKGPWQAIWDGLFWRFMDVHRDFFTQNPRLGMLVKTLDKMDPGKKAQHLKHAENWLQQLDSWNASAAPAQLIEERT